MTPIPVPHGSPDVYFRPIRTQWENPTDILSILMIIGGDVVQRAIAQLAGSGPRPFSFAPVAFSFGWVAYALSALLSTVGDGRLLPPPETSAVLINAKSGYTSAVQSWPLSRLIRDHKPPSSTSKPCSSATLNSDVRGKSRNECPSNPNGITTSDRQNPIFSFLGRRPLRLDDSESRLNSNTAATMHSDAKPRAPNLSKPEDASADRGLHVTFYGTLPRPVGVPDFDRVYMFSLVVIVVQLAISVIPGILHGNWMILIITAGGTFLATAGGMLPQWQAEKWKAREMAEDKGEIVCLTRGNGSKSVMVITSDKGVGLRLADLANGREARSRITQWATIILFVLWIVLLLTVEGLEADAWYSLALGALGMIQNIIAAGAERSPGALGFHLELTAHVYDTKVFSALQKAEKVKSGVGISLIPTFFPGGLREDEERWVKETKENATRNAAARFQSPPRPAPLQTPHTSHLGSAETLAATPPTASLKSYEVQFQDSRGHSSSPNVAHVETQPRRPELGGASAPDGGHRLSTASTGVVSNVAAGKSYEVEQLGRSGSPSPSEASSILPSAMSVDDQ